MRKLFNDEVGFIVSAELVLVLTIAVLAMVVGLASVSHAITSELVDLSNAFGSIDQSYNVKGMRKSDQDCGSNHPDHAKVAAFGWNDRQDACDCVNAETFSVCGKNQTGGGNSEQGGD